MSKHMLYIRKKVRHLSTFLIISWIMHHLVLPQISLWAKRLMWNVVDSFFPPFSPQFSHLPILTHYQTGSVKANRCFLWDMWSHGFIFAISWCFSRHENTTRTHFPKISILVKQFFGLLMFSKVARGWVGLNLCQIQNWLQSQPWDIIFKNILLHLFTTFSTFSKERKLKCTFAFNGAI